MFEMRLSTFGRSRLAIYLGTAAVCLTLSAHQAAAQKPKKDKSSGYDRSQRATVLHDAIVYVSPDADGQKISLVTPGHEVVVVERSAPWVKVFANTDVGDEEEEGSKPEFAEDENVTPASGWIRDKGVVRPSTPGGDAILYGAAANFEELATQPRAPKGAARAAQLLYKRVAEYFPDSPRAAEASWRSADVRWQLDRADLKTLPSAKEQEAYLRPQIYEGDMKKVARNYPGSKFAAQAAFELLDNKLCGDWQGLPKCPEMESGLYEKYAQQFPDGPKAAEALYNATYRQGVLVTMYTVEENRKKAEAAAARTQSLAQQLQVKFPQSDFAARASAIAYKVQQNIVIFGNDRD